MKNVALFLVILIVVGGGGWFLINKNKVEAPMATGTTMAPDATDMDGMDMSGMTGMPDTTATPPANTTPGTPTVGADGVKEFTVTGQNYSFTPSVINVNKGDKVRIIFQNTQGMHNFILDEFGVASQTAKAPYQEILEFTADKTGTFQYYCSVGNHRAMGMFGTLTVS